MRRALLVAVGSLLAVVAPAAAVAAQLRPGYVGVVALEQANAVAILSGPPWRVVRRVAVASGPHNVSASRDGRLVAVTSPPADEVTIFRMPQATVVARVAIPGYPMMSGSRATAATSGSRRSTAGA